MGRSLGTGRSSSTLALDSPELHIGQFRRMAELAMYKPHALDSHTVRALTCIAISQGWPGTPQGRGAPCFDDPVRRQYILKVPRASVRLYYVARQKASQVLLPARSSAGSPTASPPHQRRGLYDAECLPRLTPAEWAPDPEFHSMTPNVRKAGYGYFCEHKQ